MLFKDTGQKELLPSLPDLTCAIKMPSGRTMAPGLPRGCVGTLQCGCLKCSITGLCPGKDVSLQSERSDQAHDGGAPRGTPQDCV